MTDLARDYDTQPAPLDHPVWRGVDLDCTLAHYDGWKGIEVIGEPIPAMADRVRRWLARGERVKIFTARANHGEPQISHIQDWAEKHFGARLEVTCTKDFACIEIWDDKAIGVEPNTGRRIGE